MTIPDKTSPFPTERSATFVINLGATLTSISQESSNPHISGFKYGHLHVHSSLITGTNITLTHSELCIHIKSPPIDTYFCIIGCDQSYTQNSTEQSVGCYSTT